MFNSIYTSSLSAMDKSRREFAITSHNIANAEDPNYSRVKINTSANTSGDFPSGVRIDSYGIDTDDFLQNNYYANISESSYDSAIKDSLKLASELFGNPQDNMGLDASMRSIMESIEKLSHAPDSASLQFIAINALESFTDKISNVALGVQKLRQKADLDLYTALNEANAHIQNLFTSNTTINKTNQGSLENISAVQNSITITEKLSEYFGLYNYRDSDGKTQVYTLQGDNLVTDTYGKLQYTPLTVSEDFYNGTEFQPLTMTLINQDGRDLMTNQVIIDGGLSSDIKNKYHSGKIGALIELRDTYLPRILQQLDSLAYSVKNSFNAVHNNGVGFPPAQNLLGTNLVTRAAECGFTGNVRIIAIGLDGNSLPGVPALNLNLSSLDSGRGPGTGNIQNILNEINYHFVNRVSVDKKYQLGNVSDVKLISNTSSFSPSSTIKFDLELENFSQTNASVQMLSVTATDSTATPLTSNFLNTPSSATAGLFTRIGNGAGISVDLPASINYPIDIDVQLQVNDGTTTSTGTVRYTINAPVSGPLNGLINTRFSASSRPVPTDNGSIYNPPLSRGVLSASLTTDGSGSIGLTDSITPSFMRLQTNSHNYRIAIDNLDSKQVGVPGVQPPATNLNFSQFLGLNDLFIRKDVLHTTDTLNNCALNLTVRQDILDDASLLSKTKINPLVDYTGLVANTYQYSCAEGSAEVINDFTAMFSQPIFFTAASGLPASSLTIQEYISSIVAYSASEASLASSKSFQADLITSAIGEKLRNIRGVDINEEMTNLMMFQQSFAASAKAMQIANELYDTLLKTF